MFKTTIKTIKTRTNSCKNTTQIERRREDEMRNGEKMNREKMNHKGGEGFYTTIFPTEILTKTKIILFLAVALNSVGISLIFAPKF